MSKFKLTLFSTVLLLLLAAAQQQKGLTKCNNSEVQLPGTKQCVECNSLLHGCIKCSMTTDEIQSVQCEVCDWSLYLLKVNGKKDTAEHQSLCVARCEDFAVNFVSNPATMKCEYCGDGCTECSAKHGCLKDFRIDHGYKLGIDYPSGEFPFSQYYPSRQFETATRCKDARCDKCQENDDVLSTMVKDATEVMKDAKKSFKVCDSCYQYVDPGLRAEKNYFFHCPLCESQTVQFCAQCDISYPETCLSCQKKYYLDTQKNECVYCDVRFDVDHGCKRCSATECLECMEGYYRTDENGVKVCKKCDLTEFNSKYLFQPKRCTQCQGDNYGDEDDGKKVCKYCDIGFLNSASNPKQCALKCDAGQYPEITFIQGGDVNFENNENQIDETTCKECPPQCKTCLGPDPDNDCTGCDPANQYLLITQRKDGKDRQAGKCETKDPTSFDISIFVSNTKEHVKAYTEDPSKQDGSIDNPFINFEDAITRMDEKNAKITSPSEKVTDVTIYLFRGDHFVINRHEYSIYIYTKKEFSTQHKPLNYKLTIQPLPCSKVSTDYREKYGWDICVLNFDEEKGPLATLVNKKQEKFHIDVANELKLWHVSIDSVDSILFAKDGLTQGHDAAKCLMKRKRCCRIDSNRDKDGFITSHVRNYDENDEKRRVAYNCSQAFVALRESFEFDCYANWPNRTMFPMRVNNLTEVKEPNHLILENSEIVNTFYAMNSLIQMAVQQGRVSVKNSKFHRISICGAIIKNYEEKLPLPDLKNFLNQEQLSSKQIKNIVDQWNEQIKLNKAYVTEMYPDAENQKCMSNQEWNSRYEDNADASENSTFNTNLSNMTDKSFYKLKTISGIAHDNCFEINIDRGNFSEIPFKMIAVDQTNISQTLVNEKNGLKHQGSILTLREFTGKVKIQNSNFTDNVHAYNGCIASESLLKDPQPLSSLNNYRQLINNGNSEFNQYQLKSLISVTRQKNSMFFYGNTFKDNVSLKGIIVLEMAEPAKAGLIFYHNNFESNSAIIGANVIHIRRLQDQDKKVKEKEQICGGAMFQKNVFKRNIGCSETYGAIHMVCEPWENLQKNDKTTYKKYDHLDFAELLDKNEAYKVLDTDVNQKSDYKPYSSSENMKYSEKKEEGIVRIREKFDGQEYPQQLQPFDVSTKAQRVQFSQNTFDENFAGKDKSIIQIEGFPTVSFIGDVIKNNKNYVPNYFRKFSPIRQFQVPDDIESIEGLDFEDRALSPLTVVSARSVSFLDTTFDNNWIADYFGSTQLQFNSNLQANSLLMIGLNGQLSFDGLKVVGHVGYQDVGDETDIGLRKTKDGFGSKLLNWYKCKFTSLKLDESSFTANLAQQTYLVDPLTHDTSPSPSPQIKRPVINLPAFFTLDQSEYALEKLTIRELTINDNQLAPTIKNTDDSKNQGMGNGQTGMIQLFLKGVTFKDLTVTNNTAVNVFLVNLPSVKGKLGVRTADIKRNQLYGGAVFKVQDANSGVFDWTAISGEEAGKINNVKFNDLDCQENTAYHSPAPCVELSASSVEENQDGINRQPWMGVSIQQVTFKQNLGLLTNDIYFDNSIKKMQIRGGTWSINLHPSKRNFDQKAQAIYKNDNRGINLKVNDVTKKEPLKQQTLYVEGITFKCENSSYTTESIQDFERNKTTGRVSVFRIEGQLRDDSVYVESLNKTVLTEEGQAYSSSTMDNHFENNKVTGCNSVDKGAVFYLDTGAQVSVEGGIYSDNSAIQGGFAYVDGRNSYFALRKWKTMERQNAYQGGIFYSKNGARINVIGGEGGYTIEGSVAVEGSFAFIEHHSSLIIIQNTITFTQMTSSKKGMLVALDGAQFYWSDSTITECKGDLDSVLIYASGNRAMYHNLYGEAAGGEYNVVESYFGYTVREEDEDGKMKIRGNGFTRRDMAVRNQEGALIKLIDTKLRMANVQIDQMGNPTRIVHMTGSDLYMKNSGFYGKGTNDDSYFSNDKIEDETTSGGLVAAYSKSTLNIFNSQFIGGRATIGGCLLLFGDTEANIDGSDTKTRFERCSAMQGGAIYASQVTHLRMNKVEMRTNIARFGMGQNIFSKMAQKDLTLENCEFYSYSITHNSIYSSGYSLRVHNVLVKDDENGKEFEELDRRVSGTGFYIDSTFLVDFRRVVIKNLKGVSGGGMYMRFDEIAYGVYKQMPHHILGRKLRRTYYSKNMLYNYVLQEVTVDNCQALEQGGGIYFDLMNYLQLKNSTISRCRAAEGGGIFFGCKKGHVCDAKLGTQVTYAHNKAKIGGGVRWNYIEPWITDSHWTNNSASNYGPDIAAIAQQIIQLKTTNTTAEQKYKNYFDQNKNNTSIRQTPIPSVLTGKFLDNIIIRGVQSGGHISQVYLAVVDKYGQVVNTNRGTMFMGALIPDPDIDKNRKKAEKKKRKFIKDEIVGDRNFFSNYGVIKVHSMSLLSMGGRTIQMNFDAYDVIDLETPTNKAYLGQYLTKKEISKGSPPDFKAKYEMIYQVKMSLIVRECKLGEFLKPTGACEECPPNSFLLEPPKKAKPCDPCDTKRMVCLGQANVGPQQGYWRASVTSKFFYKCANKAACLGAMAIPGNDTLNDTQKLGMCDVKNGYYGVQCSSCLPQFSKKSDKCWPCGPYEIYQKSVVMLLIVFGCFYLVKSIIKSAKEDKPHSVLQKILMNHMQMLIITSQFDMNWPDLVVNIFTIAFPIQALTGSITSFDCFMDTRDPAKILPYKFSPDPNHIPKVYSKLFIMAGLPLYLALICSVVWSIAVKCKKIPKSDFEMMYLASYIFLLFLIHPSMTSYMIDMFNCQIMDNVKRLDIAKLEICFQDYHAQMAYYVAMPGILLWGLGIPAAVFILMRKERDLLDTANTKQKFGFLYNGYKRNNYFWEIVIMYRKIICIIVAVFLRTQGVILQALLLLLILIVFFQLNSNRRPFAVRKHNDIEGMSLITQILTIYCGVFFISHKPMFDERGQKNKEFNLNKDFYLSKEAKYIFFAIICMCNVAFLIFWVAETIHTYRDLIKNKAPEVYVRVFLCGRQDKMEHENSKRAAVKKKEVIISKIEEIVLFLNMVKTMYIKDIKFEDHERLLELLYLSDYERKNIDLTEKQHNFLIQGPIARMRKFDAGRLERQKQEYMVTVQDEFVNMMKQKSMKENKKRMTDTPSGIIGELIKLRKWQLSQQKSTENQRSDIAGEAQRMHQSHFSARGMSGNTERGDESVGQSGPASPSGALAAQRRDLQAQMQQLMPGQQFALQQTMTKSEGNQYDSYIDVPINQDMDLDQMDEMDGKSPTHGRTPGQKPSKQNQADLEAVFKKSRNQRDRLKGGPKPRIMEGELKTREPGMDADHQPIMPAHLKQMYTDGAQSAPSTIMKDQNQVSSDSDSVERNLRVLRKRSIGGESEDQAEDKKKKKVEQVSEVESEENEEELEKLKVKSEAQLAKSFVSKASLDPSLRPDMLASDEDQDNETEKKSEVQPDFNELGLIVTQKKIGEMPVNDNFVSRGGLEDDANNVDPPLRPRNHPRRVLCGQYVLENRVPEMKKNWVEDREEPAMATHTEMSDEESKMHSTLKSPTPTLDRPPSHKIIYRMDSSGTEYSHDSDEERFETTGNEDLLISLLDQDDQLLWPKGGHKNANPSRQVQKNKETAKFDAQKDDSGSTQTVKKIEKDQKTTPTSSFRTDTDMQDYDIDVDSQTMRTAMRMAQGKKDALAIRKMEKFGGMIKKSSLIQATQFEEMSSASAMQEVKKNSKFENTSDENGFNNTGNLLLSKDDRQVEVMPGAPRGSQQQSRNQTKSRNTLELNLKATRQEDNNN